MKSVWFALPLVVLGGVVLGGACTVTTSSGPDIVTCSDDDVACGADADCCSFLCADDGFCGAPTSSCSLDNDPCEVDSDCCSEICAGDGFCGLP